MSETAPLPIHAVDLDARVRDLMTRNPRRMTSALARDLGVPEAEVIRRLPDGSAVELDPARWEVLIRSFEPLGKVHVICNTGVVVLETFGQFGNFSTLGEFFNVQSKIDMHIRFAELGAIFAVEKASHTDGARTLSFQFFTRAGDCAFKVFLCFGGREPSAERVAEFDDLRARYRLAAPPCEAREACA